MPRKRAKRKGSNRTPLSDHKLAKKILTPPLADLPAATLTYWANDRLPEILWMVLIRSCYEQTCGLDIFKEIIRFVSYHEKNKELYDLTHSGISRLDEDLKIQTIRHICDLTAGSNCLSPLLLFKALPNYEIWEKYAPAPDSESPTVLMKAVGETLWHQSQESTDVRWLIIMLMVSGQKLSGLSDKQIEEFLGYPKVGNQRTVRPAIRSLELAFRRIDPTKPEEPNPWPDKFWLDCWEKTPCHPLEQSKESTTTEIPERESLMDVWTHLVTHWQSSHSTTKINEKHDAIFGLTIFAMKIAFELWSGPHAQGILGRLGLRSIFEARVTLKYLIKQDDHALWAKWRNYGTGQAKLSALKFDDDTPAPAFITVDDLDAIASEDKWEEFVSINLGSWDESNLRDLSTKTGLKDEYDKYYAWSSSYSHGSWGAVRESCFETCTNPLHRLHRLPKPRWLPSVNQDVQLLINRMLEDLEVVYPPFPHRLDAL
ncbi:DUF5677 domain-containing protein [Zhongshania sp.]|uniref:DUF5677 domain-containing protein n=1 Tax=Zhongshania sp. TaxID=1971902 RepID=UPI0035620CB2